MFDAQSFLDMSTDAVLDTKTTPCPAGEFTAVIDKVEARQWTSKADPTKSGVTLEVFWLIDDANVKALLGRDKVTVKQGVMLDLTPEGGLDVSKGRNIGLGRLRAALNLNQAGQPFSFSMLPGRVGKVQVEHEIVGEDIYARINKVAAA